MPGLPSLFNIEWLNANAQRRYPLRDDATTRDVSNTVGIPNSLIVEFLWPVHADSGFDPTGFYVYGLSVFGAGIVIEIGYSGAIIGSVSIDTSTFTRNSTYRIQGLGAFTDTVGTIVIGSLDETLKLGGTFTFADQIATGFLPRAIVPAPRGVSAIYLKNGDDLSPPLQGDLVLEAGRNFAISFVQRAGTALDPHVISLNAIDGAGLNTPCNCAEAGNLPCIKTIDGIAPDPTTLDFALDESDCIKLNAIANGLQIVDSCAKPCCGCQELDIIKQTLERIVGQVNAMETLASRLEGQIDNMQANILAS